MAAIDTQHQDLLAQCNLLADCCEEGNDARFAEAYERLMVMARAHFAAEAAALVQLPESVREEHRHECEEFEYLVSEIVTTENFDKLELQRFLALWWMGHIAGMAKRPPG